MYEINNTDDLREPVPLWQGYAAGQSNFRFLQ